MRPVSNDIVLSVPAKVQETVVASVMLLSSRSPPETTPDGSMAAICDTSGMWVGDVGASRPSPLIDLVVGPVGPVPDATRTAQWPPDV